MESTARTDVLVIGAGPVGMTAAILLASQGIKVTVVEKNAGTANDPKAISLDDESLRVYQRAGIVEDVLRVIVPGTGTTYYAADGSVLFHGGQTVPFRFGFPFKNPFAQPDLERVLRSSLEAQPLADLRFSTELLSFTDTRDGVTASFQAADGPIQISASYILGSDGGRSKVRSLLNIPMTGRSHEDVWLVIDCLGDTHTQRFGMHHGDPRRPHVIVPGLHGRCRYEFYLSPDECDPSSDPPFPLIQQLLAPYRSISPDEVERAVAYRFHGLNADQWNLGHAFLLGDAAHMMPPFAGQGLNSGIRDAANLTWKIAAVLQDRLPSRLLDTYVLERKPHAGAVIRSSERLGRVVMTTNARLARFRDEVVRASMQTEEGRQFFEGMMYRPSTRLKGGLVIDPESNPLIGWALGQPRVFDFQQHRVVALDDLMGEGWCVLGIGITDDGDHSAWCMAQSAFAPLNARFVDIPLSDSVHDRPAAVNIAIDVDTRLYAEVEPARGKFVVVRPDRVIAAVSELTDAPEVVDRLLACTVGRPSVAATA